MPSASAAAPPGTARPLGDQHLRTCGRRARTPPSIPAAPKPTTITSAVSSQLVISDASTGVTSVGSRTGPPQVR